MVYGKINKQGNKSHVANHKKIIIDIISESHILRKTNNNKNNSNNNKSTGGCINEKEYKEAVGKEAYRPIGS